MNTTPEHAPHTQHRPRLHLWAKPWVRTVTLIVGFAVLMVVTNAVASAMANPFAALVVGPALAALMLWVYRWAGRRIEHRVTTDVAAYGARRHLLIGLVGGFALASATIGVIALLGGIRITGWGSLAGALTVIGIMCAVAVAEEVLFRGILLRLIRSRWGTGIALGSTAVLFGLVHLVNPGASLWGAVAIAIEAGLMLGAAYIVTGSLWLPIGLHLGWNVTTVAVFGTVGSGSALDGSILTSVSSGPAWLTGGAFGPEASVVSIVMCSLATMALLAIARRRRTAQAARPQVALESGRLSGCRP